MGWFDSPHYWMLKRLREEEARLASAVQFSTTYMPYVRPPRKNAKQPPKTYKPFTNWPRLCKGCVMNDPGTPAPFEGGKFYPEPHVMWLTWEQAFKWANSIGATFKTVGTLKSAAIKRGVRHGRYANAPSAIAPVDRVSLQQFIYGYLDWKKPKAKRKKPCSESTGE